MTALYRAVYAPRDGRLRPRGMTYAADDALEAVRVAEDWELPSERLLTVKRLRGAVRQLELAAPAGEVCHV